MKKFQCDKCGFETDYKIALAGHKRSHNPKKVKKPKKPETVTETGTNITEAPMNVTEEPTLVAVNLKNTITVNGFRYGGVHYLNPSLAQEVQYRDGQIELRKKRELETHDRPYRQIANLKG